jgi:hypothetical protein
MFLELTISSANTGIAQPLQCGETRINVFIRLFSNSFEETLKRLEWLDDEHRRDKTAISTLEKRLQALLTLAHEWVATYEKTFNKSN